MFLSYVVISPSRVKKKVFYYKSCDIISCHKEKNQHPLNEPRNSPPKKVTGFLYNKLGHQHPLNEPEISHKITR